MKRNEHVSSLRMKICRDRFRNNSAVNSVAIEGWNWDARRDNYCSASLHGKHFNGGNQGAIINFFSNGTIISIEQKMEDKICVCLTRQSLLLQNIHQWLFRCQSPYLYTKLLALNPKEKNFKDEAPRWIFIESTLCGSRIFVSLFRCRNQSNIPGNSLCMTVRWRSHTSRLPAAENSYSNAISVTDRFIWPVDFNMNPWLVKETRNSWADLYCIFRRGRVIHEPGLNWSCLNE